MLSPTSSAFRSGGDHARIIQGPILVLKRALQQIIDQWTYYYLLSSVFFCMCQPKWLLLLLLCQYTSISSKPIKNLLCIVYSVFSSSLWNRSLNTVKKTPRCSTCALVFGCWELSNVFSQAVQVPVQSHICFDDYMIHCQIFFLSLDFINFWKHGK